MPRSLRAPSRTPSPPPAATTVAPQSGSARGSSSAPWATAPSSSATSTSIPRPAPRRGSQRTAAITQGVARLSIPPIAPSSPSSRTSHSPVYRALPNSRWSRTVAESPSRPTMVAARMTRLRATSSTGKDTARGARSRERSRDGTMDMAKHAAPGSTLGAAGILLPRTAQEGQHGRYGEPVHPCGD
jgi:hypothetical protein